MTDLTSLRHHRRHQCDARKILSATTIADCMLNEGHVGPHWGVDDSSQPQFWEWPREV